MAALDKSVLTDAMRHACTEARKWIGATSPNPAVGAAALDAEGNILMLTAHTKAGEAHAEALLIEQAQAKNLLPLIHTLCVTLEPCNHYGRTPPCTDAIIRSGIKHLAIGIRDPNPNVKGHGIEKLRDKGIEIICGINENECQHLIHAFAFTMKHNRPWITIKRALSNDGSMIPPPGKKTFTSIESLTLAHRLRKKAGAIMTGNNTVLMDDPLFTVRHIQDFQGKHRILAIMDREKKVPATYLKLAHERGFEPITYQDLNEAVASLTKRGVQDILVEAGPTLCKAIFDSQLWTMSVTIRAADRDMVDVKFNPKDPIPFKADEFQWDYFLPE